MERPVRTRRIRFKSNISRQNSEPEDTGKTLKDEFEDFEDSDYSSSDSTSSEDENQSLSFPGSHAHKHNTSLCQDIYVKSCRHLSTVPSTYFFRRLKRAHIDMSHHGLRESGTKPIAIALVGNTTVQKLNMASNDIRCGGLNHILETLEENTVLTELNISNNNLLSDGAKLLSKALSHNRSVTRLDISANGFSENDALHISKMMKKNQVLRTLVISKNNFGEEGGIYISKALECNKTLKQLDLSWNHLRQRGAVALCYCLQVNINQLDLSWNHLRQRGAVALCYCLQNNNTLESINLAWNGFGMEGCHEMGKTLLINRSLSELDLSSNRVSLDAFRQLLHGVGKNKTLKILRIGCNPLTTDGAIAILRSIVISESSLEEIDLTDVSVDDSFVDLLNEIKEKRDIRVIHGIVLRHDEITKGARKCVLDTDEPVAILFEYMKQKNLRLIDLLHNLDRDHSDTLTRDEFQRGMASIDLPLSSRALDTLMQKLDINKDGQVDYEELAIKHKEYLRRVTKLKMQAKDGAKFYKGYDKLEQLREAVRLKITLNIGRDSPR